MSDAINSIKIGKPLENLADEAIRDFQLRLDVLNIPSFLRESIWDELTRRALAKALECKRSWTKCAWFWAWEGGK